MMKKDVQIHIQSPVLNNSHHDAVLQTKVTLGSLNRIRSISPLGPLKLTGKGKQELVPQSKIANTTRFSVD